MGDFGKLVKEDEEEEEEQQQQQHGRTRKLLVVTTRNVKAGELATLYPMKCISTDQSDIPLNLLDKERYPYPLLRSTTTTTTTIGTEQLYVHSIPSSSSSVLHGWYGNLVDETKGGILGERGNCVLVPLAGVAPLYGIVAIRDIPCDEKLLREVDLEADCDMEIHRIATNVAKAYAFEFAELMSYLQMASSNIPMARSKPPSQQQQPSYHCINQQYPNILKIHSNPDIYTVSDFLSQNECERLIAKASLGMQPCLVKNANTGLVEPDPSRTSTNANIPQREVPSITQKMTSLANCSQEQLEILQVLNYKRGQEFKAHTDGFDSGPTSACGFLDSGRIATVFCYLNDVPEGGTTLFTKLGLEIKPKRGLAVIHFPMSLELIEDERTEHQGSVAIDEKWILTTWVWKHWKGDYRYDEDRLPILSADII
eukprot:CAMPEP_0176504280 /NCGR_PEP_ID=MMETSP0200_2-20121128/15844_1 /TAXON_ID=947934 /ORGANISM="Chaetoceros sp., Strain GSL56" /LENGTH=425 /DNA_ID=CAMNT_0017903691 /DNA_START=404 /DNA_END=1682 /DNA_ORIENTATION=+